MSYQLVLDLISILLFVLLQPIIWNARVGLVDRQVAWSPGLEGPPRAVKMYSTATATTGNLQ